MTVQEFMQEGKSCFGCRTIDRKKTSGKLSQETYTFLQQQVNAGKISQNDYNFFEHRPSHWNAGCEILVCCVDEKKLNSCHKCPEFVCEKLDEWAKSGERCAQAVERLQELRDCAHDSAP